MPIDASIYSQYQAPDILGNVQKGMSIREMADERVAKQKAIQQQEQIKAAYLSGVTKNPDGTTSVDPGKTLSALAAVSPLEAQKYQAQQTQMKTQNMEQKAQELDLTGRVLGGVNDAQGWENAKNVLAQSGVDVSRYKDVPYDPKLQQQLLGMTLTQKDRIAQQLQQQAAARADRHEATYEKDVAVKAGQRSDQKQNQALQQTQQLLESARGNSAVTQAQKDMYAAQKFESLANLKGDPNNLNPAQVQLAAMEVAKIASGGVPTAHELQGLTPSSIPGGLAEAAQKFVNHPVAANQGAFVNAMKDYTSALKKDAQDVIKDKYGRVLESRKAQLGNANYQTLKQQYMSPFDEKAVAAAHPQDAQAVQWAKSNPNDPRAAQILQLNGAGQ